MVLANFVKLISILTMEETSQRKWLKDIRKRAGETHRESSERKFQVLIATEKQQIFPMIEQKDVSN